MHRTFLAHATALIRATSNKIISFGWYAVIGAGLLLIAGWFFFLRGGDKEVETLTVAPGEFLQQVSVSGKVVAADDVDLGFAQGGRVSGVYTEVGDTVQTGSILAEVENGDLRALVLQRQATLEAEEAELASIKEGTRPEELALAEADVAQDTAALIDELRDAYRAADSAVRNTTDPIYSNPRTSPVMNFSTTNTQIKADAESRRLTLENTLTEWLVTLPSLETQSDLSPTVSLAQSDLSAVATYLTVVNAALSGAIPNQSVPQSTIDGYISDVATARTNVNTAISSLTTAVAALDTSKRNLTLKQAGSTPSAIAAQEAQVKAAAAGVADAQAQLRKTLIVAPFRGTVTAVNAKVGQPATAGSTQVSLIGNTLQIESFVPEVNIALLETGDEATVTLDAYGEEVPFAARIASLDPAETVRDGVSTYRAVLEFTSPDARIRAGMTANVLITTERKENVISVPQRIVMSRDGKKYVSVQVGKETVEREVTVGSVSSLGDAEVTSGLNAGDVVILTQ